MSFMPNARIIAATTALLCSPVFLGAAPAEAQDGGFRDCLNNIKADALKQGESLPAALATMRQALEQYPRLFDDPQWHALAPSGH